MKKTITIILIFFCAAYVKTQVPQAVKFQALARNTQGEVLKQKEVAVRISLLNSSSVSVYKESHRLISSPYGVLDFNIGEGIVESGDFSSIDWGESELYVKVEIDENGGTSFSEIGVSKLLSVPYALHANVADSIATLAPETDPVFLASQAARVTEGDIIKISNLSGVNTGDQDLSNYATLEIIDSLLLRISSLEEQVKAINGEPVGDSVSDHEGNYYKIVKIGNQTWMAENLRVTSYYNGTPLQFIMDENNSGSGDDEWAALPDDLTTRAYCWYNDNVSNSRSHGAYYTYGAATNGTPYYNVDIQGICPTGWHLPGADDWTELATYLSENGHNYDSTTGGHTTKIGKSLADSVGWTDSDVEGAVGNNQSLNNSSGFSAKPTGYRVDHTGEFLRIDMGSYMWSSYDIVNAISLGYADPYRGGGQRQESTGMSVRCIKN